MLGYAVYQFGGVEAQDWNICLAALALLALLYWLRTPATDLAPPLDPRVQLLVFLLPCYAAFQLIPLPLSLVKAASPRRAELQAALAPVVGRLDFAPLSVVPSLTMLHVLRIAGYVIVFLLVREIGSRSTGRPWALAVPIIVVGAAEAAVGLLQYALRQPGTLVAGTYVNRNHFAGFLEMALPFAVMYPVAVLRRVHSPRQFPLRPALRACGSLVPAALVFLGIIYSLSRMGFVAAISSLFLMGALVLGRGLSVRQKWLAVGLLVGLALLSFVFLPPDELIDRFARVRGTDETPGEGRPALWRDTLRLISAYPVFGCGLGGYESAFLKYKTIDVLITDNFAHNDYLQLLAEMGLVGFVIAAGLTLWILATATRAVYRHSEADGRFLALACTGALAAILIHSLADFNLYIPANAMLLAWVSGIASALPFSSRTTMAWKQRGLPQFLGAERAASPE